MRAAGDDGPFCWVAMVLFLFLIAGLMRAEL
jgi:hypothetical protein